MKQVSTPAPQRGVPYRISKPPSTEEIAALLAAANKDPRAVDVQDVVTILLHTGMRRGELRQLRWSDVDFAERSITINSGRTMQVRRIPINDKTIEVLRARHERQPISDYVLGVAPRRVLDRVSHQLRTLSGQLGSRRITFHGLRHAFANRWAYAGGDIVSLASYLGHRSVCTSFRDFLSPSQRFSVNSRELARIETQSK